MQILELAKSSLFSVSVSNLPIGGERLLQTHPLIGQEVQLTTSDWTRAT